MCDIAARLLGEAVTPLSIHRRDVRRGARAKVTILRGSDDDHTIEAGEGAYADPFGAEARATADALGGPTAVAERAMQRLVQAGIARAALVRIGPRSKVLGDRSLAESLIVHALRPAVRSPIGCGRRALPEDPEIRVLQRGGIAVVVLPASATTAPIIDKRLRDLADFLSAASGAGA